MKALVADDARMIRARMVRLLSGLPGISAVLESEDYVETLALIRRERPDVVLLDVSMPGGMVLDVLRTIHCDEPRPHLIVLTGMPDAGLRERCLAVGADHFFSKSRSFLEAVNVVKQMAAAISSRE